MAADTTTVTVTVSAEGDRSMAVADLERFVAECRRLRVAGDQRVKAGTRLNGDLRRLWANSELDAAAPAEPDNAAPKPPADTSWLSAGDRRN